MLDFKRSVIKIFISVVTPSYRCSESLEELYKRLVSVLEKSSSDFEIIMVNDGSPDNDWEVIKKIAGKDKRVKGINLSRNFGHQVAVTAGMDYAKGDAVIIMDADLQDPPEVINEFLDKYKEGYHVVYGVRAERKNETFFKKATAKFFYRFLNKLSDVKIPLDTGDFRLISKEVNENLKKMKEKNRFIRGMVSWVGYPQIGVSYIRDGRFAGETQYSLAKMLKFSIDGITSFSKKPLQLAILIGFIMAFSGFIYAIYVLFLKYFLKNQIAAGWSSIVILILLVSGVQMIMLGIIGEYIARIYDEAKGRPSYIVSEIQNIDLNRGNLSE